MANKHLFAGLVVDENGNPVETAFVGDEAMYVVNDYGFRRHIPAADVDMQVLRMMTEQIKGHEDLLTVRFGSNDESSAPRVPPAE